MIPWFLNPWGEVRRLRASRSVLIGRFHDLDSNYREARAELYAIKRQRREAASLGGKATAAIRAAEAAKRKALRDATTAQLNTEAVNQ